jgi:hypothetical protein
VHAERLKPVTDQKVLRRIEIEKAHGDTASRGKWLEDDRIGLRPSKMVGPSLGSRVEETYGPIGEGICGLCKSPFARIAARARQSKVFQFRFPIQRNRSNVICGEGRHLRLLGKVAVLTPAAGTKRDGRAKFWGYACHG